MSKYRSTCKTLVLATLLAAALGCSSTPESKAQQIVANRKKGGHLRLVNLSDQNVRLMFGPRQFTQAAPGEGTPYSLYRPGSHEAQLIVGPPDRTHTIKIEISSGTATAIYLLNATDGTTKVVHGDEVRASEAGSSLRLVNLTESPTQVMAESGGINLSAEARNASQVAKLAAGQVKLSVKDHPLSLDQAFEAGTAYSLVLYRKGGKTEYLLLESSQKQEIQAQGASPSG